MYIVYIVACADTTLYTGLTNDLPNRLEQHNTGKAGAKYTRARRPVKLVYQERAPNRSAALKREAAIKRLTRAEKFVLIQKKKQP